MQPSIFRRLTAAFQAFMFGLLSQSSFSGVEMPHVMHSRTSDVKSVRKISGSVFFARMSNSFHKRMHFPGAVRPARPARCSAEKKLILSVTSFSMPAEIMN